ncbi:prophage endopeptidase tail family protein [Staphylococcus xylosus]|uniref:prophage endopeptidase tail family protein n=1 Tax=Staphylococcus xylosus TaxID=1288 RepID=UPI001CDBFAE5|nr:prophage endopeptidase tail family protein [Staphylococcus xylosus]MCQ3816714.1 peptidase [Staphylococcus xylosus]MCQ3819232.1 peptidase [Staphylococcus xylosus]UBV36659.1 phage tail protein [Staphylococcus xylosus]
MKDMVLKNKKGTFGEILVDYDFGSWKLNYEKNNERSIDFTIYKTYMNSDLFDALLNEMLIIWKGQEYVIKSTTIKYDGAIVSNDVTAKHIFMEFQNHYIQKDLENEEMNNEETTDEDNKPTMTLEQFLEFGFKGNKLGFTYEIKGNFNNRVAIDELGHKNGMEFLTEGAELFNYVYFADNKKIYIYDEETFYQTADIPLIYKYNSSEVQATTTTTDIKTYIQGYGKKKTKTETKNYNPVKPPNLNYNGKFFKEGTWRTQEVGASYSEEFDCKWGNETLTWSLKKLSRGGLLDVYIDNVKIDRYSCYSHTARTESIVIARNLSKGKHTFKAVFIGPDPNVKEYKTAPVMYVGTEKSTTLNLTAVLKGNDLYHTYAEYKSPNAEEFGWSEAPTVFADNVLDKDELVEKLKSELNDEPTIEVSTNYLGSVEEKHYLKNDDIKENSKIRFIHQPLGYNLDLKVVKITQSHPLVNEPVEVDFSNSPADIIKIQQGVSRKIKKINNLGKGGSLSGSSFTMPKLASDSIGSVLVDE